MAAFKVLIVDDSKLMCDILTSIIGSDPRFEVVGSAKDAYEARNLIKLRNPDVVTLDVEMPKMSGISFLSNLMRLNPLPVVMISTLTSKGSTVTMQALELGAIDFIEKPSDIRQLHGIYRQLVTDKVAAAAAVSRDKLTSAQRRLTVPPVQQAGAGGGQAPQITPVPSQRRPEKLLAIGGSTGGLEALKDLLVSVKFSGAEAIVVCLHLPGAFTQSFASRLDAELPVKVKEAQDGERILPGYVYIAPGGRHLRIRRKAVGYECVVSDDEPVNLHKPSVDVLFDSMAEQAGHHGMGVILTGMGKDGAKGLLNMANKGAKTLGQDEASSIVWGMPGEAVHLQAVSLSDSLPLVDIAERVTRYFNP